VGVLVGVVVGVGVICGAVYHIVNFAAEMPLS
jgi:hypothetical protein